MSENSPILAQTNSDGTEVNPPKVLYVNDAPVSGGPTTPSPSRGVIANTSIAMSNANLAHVCDLPNSIKYEIAKLTISVSGLINTIRTELEALWSSAASSPIGDQIKGAIQTIKAKIKVVQKFIRDNLGPQSDIANFIASVQELIVFISTLPARIASFLTQCLSDATKSLSDAVAVGKNIQSQIQSGTIAQANIDVVLQDAILVDAEKYTSPIIATKP